MSYPHNDWLPYELSLPQSSVHTTPRARTRTSTNTRSTQLKRKIHSGNEPLTVNDCWFVQGGESDTSGYPVKKIASRGERNKWRVHRLLFFVVNPALAPAAAPPAHQVVAHRCGRGRYDHARGISEACINPHHLVLVSQSVNLDHDKCRRSCAAWCPHRPRCVFTNDRGRWLPCRNAVPLRHPCGCVESCFPEEEEEGEEEEGEGEVEDA